MKMAENPPGGAASADTPARLIAAGREVFCEVGFKRARMEDIAARAGVSRATLYYHFNTKGDLASAIADDVLQRLTAIVRSTLADGPLDGVIAAATRFFADQAALARLLIAELAPPMDPFEHVARHREALLTLLRRRISSDIAAGLCRPVDPEVAAQAILGLMRAPQFAMMFQEVDDIDHTVEELTRFMKHALSPST